MDQNNTLFSFEETEVSPKDCRSIQLNGPVTILGMSFPNDDSRREYFRKKLKDLLPSLRMIEGFPEGSDEDILTLSDPPYYTACPNPWAKDLLAEWESQKNELSAKGDRDKSFEVHEPYAADVSEGKNNPIYMAHAYHTKVPYSAIMKYLLHYTEPGDIVFDGFCGTGMTGVASNLCGSSAEVQKVNPIGKVGVRKCLCSDLSPIASLISASYNLSYNATLFEKKAKAILDQVDKELGWMYETEISGHKAKANYYIWSDVFTCPNCGEEIIFWDYAVDLNGETIKDSFECKHCGSTLSKKNLNKGWETVYDPIIGETVRRIKKAPVRVNYVSSDGRRGEADYSEFDKAIWNKASDISSCNYLGAIPDGDESSRNYALGLKHIHQLFTERNLRYLTRVNQLVSGDAIMQAWFTSVIQNASIMYKFRLDRKGGIVSGTLFVPSLNIEQNPSKLLRAKIRDFVQSAHSFRNNTIVGISSATNLATIPDDSIDYMFIDPPFGANLMYSELNSIWEGWLRVITETTSEAIVNHSQGKSLFDYQTLMNRSLKEFYRILKPGKWLTLEFSNTSAAVWNSIQNALQGVGFVVANVAALDKKQGSFKAVTTTTAVKQDLVITCYKPSSNLTDKFESSGGSVANVWEFIDEYLCHLPVHIERGNATTSVIERSPKILYDRVITYYVQHGYPVPIDAGEFQAGLRDRYVERDMMFFTAAQVAEYEEKKKQTSDFIPMGLIVSNESDGIEWLRIQLVKPKTYQEIQPDWMQAINGLRKNDILPELSVLLDENFIQEEDGKWRLPNIQDDVDKFKLRTKALLKEFKLYVEQASKPKAKIKEVRVEAVRAGFKQCYIDKDFQTIVTVGDKIPQNLLEEDEILLQFYDIAVNHI